MARSLNQIIVELHRYWKQVDERVIGQAHADLQGIFGRAEARLYDLRDHFYGLADADGKLVASPKALVQAAAVLRGLQQEIDKWLVGGGKTWVDRTLPQLLIAGRGMARLNLKGARGVDPDLLAAALHNVSDLEKGVLKVGYDTLYPIMGTVGDDVARWMRQTLMDAMVEGIPVQAQGDGDSLMKRLFDSGRLRPITVRTKEGKLITRSVAQRAQAIARVETTRIINRVHQVKSEEVLGPEAKYKDSGPLDNRTTEVCIGASRQPAMTRQEWIRGPYGLPPRIAKQFHLCRHFLIGVAPGWEDRRVDAARERAIEEIKGFKDAPPGEAIGAPSQLPQPA